MYSLFEIIEPTTDPMRRTVPVQFEAPRVMDEHSAQVTVPTLGDTAQSDLVAG